jgi:hypothetical protein
MLDKELDKYPSFMNLKTLSMTSCLDTKTFLVDGRLGSSCDPHEKFNALARLLHKAPNLERLTLENCWVRNSFFIPSTTVTMCFFCRY